MKDKLTTRQFQIAELYIWAGRKKVVAQALGIAPYTVDNTLRKVYERLDIYPEELAAYYMLHHLGVELDKSPMATYPQIVSGATWGLTRRGIIKSLVGVILLTVFSVQIYNGGADLYRTARSQNRTQRTARTQRQSGRRELEFLSFLGNE